MGDNGCVIYAIKQHSSKVLARLEGERARGHCRVFFCVREKIRGRKKCLEFIIKKSCVLVSHVPVSIITSKIHDYAIPTRALGLYTIAFLCGLYS